MTDIYYVTEWRCEDCGMKSSFDGYTSFQEIDGDEINCDCEDGK